MIRYNEFIEFFKTSSISDDVRNSISIHKHHILPIHAGGDKNGETVELTICEHQIAHLLRYYELGKKQDRTSACMLSGYYKSLKEYAAKRAVEVSRERKTNAFFNEELRLKSCSMGGKVTGAIHRESGHLKRLAQLKHGKKNKGKVLVNNGIISLMIHEKDIPDGFVRGRLPNMVLRKKDYVVANDGIINKRVNKNEIPDGFVRGMLPRTKK